MTLHFEVEKKFLILLLSTAKYFFKLVHNSFAASMIQNGNTVKTLFTNTFTGSQRIVYLHAVATIKPSCNKPVIRITRIRVLRKVLRRRRKISSRRTSVLGPDQSLTQS